MARINNEVLGYGNAEQVTFHVKWTPIDVNSIVACLDGIEYPAGVDPDLGSVTFKFPPPRGAQVSADYDVIEKQDDVAPDITRKNLHPLELREREDKKHLDPETDNQLRKTGL